MENFDEQGQKRELEKVIQAIENMIVENEQHKTFSQEDLIEDLKTAYCDETTAWWQYFTALHIIRGAGRMDAVAEYEQHLQDELQHLQKIATRIEQLGGTIIYQLDDISKYGNAWERVKESDAKEQIMLLIRAERSARDFYQKIIYKANYLRDWTTSNLFKDILDEQTQHEFDLRRLLEELE